MRTHINTEALTAASRVVNKAIAANSFAGLSGDAVRAYLEALPTVPSDMAAHHILTSSGATTHSQEYVISRQNIERFLQTVRNNLSPALPFWQDVAMAPRGREVVVTGLTVDFRHQYTVTSALIERNGEGYWTHMLLNPHMLSPLLWIDLAKPPTLFRSDYKL